MIIEKSKIKEIIQEGDVLLTLNTELLLSKTISEVTDSEYSHTIYVLSKDCCIESTVGGTKKTKIDHYLKGTYNIAILRSDLTQDQIKKKTKFLLEKIGERYSYLQIISGLFRFIFKVKNTPDVDPKATVCSELVAWGDFKVCGRRIVPGVDYWEAAPGDFMKSPFYKLIAVSKHK